MHKLASNYDQSIEIHLTFVCSPVGADTKADSITLTTLRPSTPVTLGTFPESMHSDLQENELICCAYAPIS